MPVKMSSATAVDKALQLYELLLDSPRSYSAKDLSETLQCSKSTISRLVGQIEKRCGERFHRDNRDGREWYSLTRPVQGEGKPCSEDDIDRLERCVRIAAPHLPQETVEALGDVIGRLRERFAAEGGSPADALCPIAKTRIDYTSSKEVIASLLEAIGKRRIVRLTYRKGNQPQKTWAVAPLRLLTSADALYLDGRYLKETADGRFEDGQRRSLVYVQRIMDVEITSATHDFREDKGPRYFGIMATSAPFTVKARFDAGVADYVRERDYSEVQAKTLREDGSLDLSFESRSPSEVVSWILGFGRAAELLEPEDLRERLRGEMTATLDHYAPARGAGEAAGNGSSTSRS